MDLLSLLARFRWMMVLLLLLALSMLWPGAQSWAGPLSRPHRQTMPLTPPATWTPRAQAQTPIPTRPVRPTQPPTKDSAPSAETEEAEPWLGLSVDSMIVGPGSEVTVRIEVANIGGGALADLHVTLAEPPELHFVEVPSVEIGQVHYQGSALIWSPGPLPRDPAHPDAETVLEVRAAIAEDVLPDHTITLRAVAEWPQGASVAGEVALALPWALLPDSGVSPASR